MSHKVGVVRVLRVGTIPAVYFIGIAAVRLTVIALVELAGPEISQPEVSGSLPEE